MHYPSPYLLQNTNGQILNTQAIATRRGPRALLAEGVRPC